MNWLGVGVNALGDGCVDDEEGKAYIPMVRVGEGMNTRNWR